MPPPSLDRRITPHHPRYQTRRRREVAARRLPRPTPRHVHPATPTTHPRSLAPDPAPANTATRPTTTALAAHTTLTPRHARLAASLTPPPQSNGIRHRRLVQVQLPQHPREHQFSVALDRHGWMRPRAVPAVDGQPLPLNHPASSARPIPGFTRQRQQALVMRLHHEIRDHTEPPGLGLRLQVPRSPRNGLPDGAQTLLTHDFPFLFRRHLPKMRRLRGLESPIP